jgi:hypothetical protein
MLALGGRLLPSTTQTADEDDYNDGNAEKKS